MPLLGTLDMSTIIAKIHNDDDPIDPRKDYDNLGTMMCWHRRYTLGDKQLPREWEPDEWIKEYVPQGSVILELYLYDHSGITMSTGSFSCGWDSGQVGVIFATPEQIRECYMVKRITKKVRAQAEECLKNEVAEYDHMLTGQVYGYTLETSEDCATCSKPELEPIDSCWGFTGPDAIKSILAETDPKYHEALQSAWDSR